MPLLREIFCLEIVRCWEIGTGQGDRNADETIIAARDTVIFNWTSMRRGVKSEACDISRGVHRVFARILE